jgi:prepilin-type N-terminal cleavage/methylation domain-containing protein
MDAMRVTRIAGESGTGARRSRRAGFTLVECLTALIILAIGLVGVITIFVAGIATHKKAIDQTTAGTLGQKVLAELEANLTEAYLNQLAARIPNEAGAARNPKRRLELKDQIDPDFNPDIYRYDLSLQPLDPQRREAYAVILRVKWLEGGVEQSALFQTVMVRKLDR